MNILQVFDFFSPSHGGGGVVDNLYRLSRDLSGRGHNVVLYTGDFDLDRGYVSSLRGVAVRPFHNRLKIAGLYVMPGLIAESRRSLKEFDVIHLHSFRSFQNIVLHHYAVKYGIPYIVDAHGSTPRIAAGGKGPMPFFKWLYDVFFGYRMLRDAGKLVAETRVGAGEYIRLGAARDRIALVHPPLDVSEFAALPAPGLFRQKHGIGEKKIVMSLGRINWIKGLDFLVEAFARLARQRQDARLVIAGPDDGYQPTLEKQIGSLGISDRVLFPGFLSGTDKLAALVDADVLVHPSVYEQGARTPLEALMCGTPVVVSRDTGAGEIIRDMEAGYLIEHGDIPGLNDIIQDILDSPGEALDRVRKARGYIGENLSLAAQTENYEKLYAEVIESNKRRTGA